jgi:hypothetical protein
LTLPTFVSSKASIETAALRLLAPQLPVSVRLMGIRVSAFNVPSAGSASQPKLSAFLSDGAMKQGPCGVDNTKVSAFLLGVGSARSASANQSSGAASSSAGEPSRDSAGAASVAGGGVSEGNVCTRGAVPGDLVVLEAALGCVRGNAASVSGLGVNSLAESAESPTYKYSKLDASLVVQPVSDAAAETSAVLPDMSCCAPECDRLVAVHADDVWSGAGWDVPGDVPQTWAATAHATAGTATLPLGGAAQCAHDDCAVNANGLHGQSTANSAQRVWPAPREPLKQTWFTGFLAGSHCSVQSCMDAQQDGGYGGAGSQGRGKQIVLCAQCGHAVSPRQVREHEDWHVAQQLSAVVNGPGYVSRLDSCSGARARCEVGSETVVAASTCKRKGAGLKRAGKRKGGAASGPGGQSGCGSDLRAFFGHAGPTQEDLAWE